MTVPLTPPIVYLVSYALGSIPFGILMDLDFALKRIQSLTGAKFDAVVVGALEAAVTTGKLRLSAVEVQV